MVEVQKMEFKINSSPLTMSEITKRLFNFNFHSDIQFIVEGKIIYAHSLELIKRSVVFEQQLEDSMGNKKVIHIDNYKYESFFEFIRYIYTDECTINDDNFIDILKLAIKYKLFKLESQVFSVGSPTLIWRLKCFELCVLTKYELARNFLKEALTERFEWLLTSKQFLSLHPDALDELLKFDYVPKDVTEMQIFTAVAKWITAYCNMHQITLSEGRQRWDKIFRKIRFPTMSNVELGECHKRYPEILSASDCTSIVKDTVFDDNDGENDLWISEAREEFAWPTDYSTFPQNAEFDTVISVSRDTIFLGLRIGIEQKRKPVEIEISETADETNERPVQKLKFVQNAPDKWNQLLINLGDSLHLKPNFKYMVRIKYLEVVGNLKVHCLTDFGDVILNDSDDTVNIHRASDNIVEMIFKTIQH